MGGDTQLLIRETILGVIKAKDLDGTGIIHTSDFKAAVNDLGFSFGSKVVEDMLVHCKIDNNGNINYQQLERELLRERRVVNTQSDKNNSKPISSSASTPVRPWRADVAHQEKVSVEHQSKNVHEHRDTVHKIYQQLSHHQIGVHDAIRQLQALDIHPTSDFIRIINMSTYAEVTFTEFLKSLIIYDPKSSFAMRGNVAAGSVNKRNDVILALSQKDADKEFFVQRKRTNQGVADSVFNSGMREQKSRPAKKMTDTKDQMIFKSNKIRDIVFAEDTNIPLISHSQQDMLTGNYGKGVSIAFNSELRLQREQILAALRKLDAGELSMNEFQDKVYSMGFDLPEAIAADIARSVQAGRLDWRRFVNLLDANVFKVNALDNKLLSDDVCLVRRRFLDTLKSRGMSSLLNLSKTFAKMDTDGNRALSFCEFWKGCREIGLSDISEGEFRALFNSFDENGDGFLQYEEFFKAIRGDLAPTRHDVVQRAFLKLNRKGTGKVLIDDAVEQFRGGTVHPEVLQGIKSERDVVNEFVRWFASNEVSLYVLSLFFILRVVNPW